jgi:hypothetical protein
MILTVRVRKKGLNDVIGDFLTQCPSRGWSLKAQPFNPSRKHQVTIPSPQRRQTRLTLAIKSFSVPLQSNF